MRDTVSGTDLRPTFQPNPFSIFGRDETQTDRQTYRQNDRQTADLISQLTMGEIKMITIKIITEVSIAARASFTFYFIFFLNVHFHYVAQATVDKVLLLVAGVCCEFVVIFAY